MADRPIANIADNPERIAEAASWFSAKWGIPAEAYAESMEECVASQGCGVPQWFVIRDGDDPSAAIIAGCGIIENDFHNRPDLAPNLCALYVEERHRGNGLARKLLDHARSMAGTLGFEHLYLVTDHTGLYEKCGWEYLFDVNEEDGGAIRMYRTDTISNAANEPAEIQEATAKDNPDLLEALVVLWRESVEATHDFLGPEDIERIAGYVPQAIESVPHLAVAKDTQGTLLGFVGVDGDTVEMLFVHPKARGNGTGARLLNYATGSCDATKLDVNEQNEQARGFYERMGFEVVGRSETDDMGDPFPILHLQLTPSSPSR